LTKSQSFLTLKMSPNPKDSPTLFQNEGRSKTTSPKPSMVSERVSILDSLISSLFFWGERYDKDLQRLWNKVPSTFGRILASLAVFLFGATAKGEWIIFAVYAVKYLQTFGSPSYREESEALVDSLSGWMNLRFQGYWNTWFWSTVISYVSYFGIGGFLHWYYYVRQRYRPQDWKCQPKQWLSPSLERHEIAVGSLSLVFGSAISAAVSTYVKNGGSAIKLHVSPMEHGLLWLLLQIPLVFAYQDYMTYWHHRLYHTPWLYKNFHKVHHTYKQPTAFSVTAIHPVEFVHMQFVLLSAIFVVPVYWLNYAAMMGYVYYHGIMNHSGINFKRFWWQPWQPDTMFHDNHHQYFHVNFGFNIEAWDVLHGTYRRKDRIYREDIFYGQGKDLKEASVEELKEEMEERESENPLAYSGNTNLYSLGVKRD